MTTITAAIAGRTPATLAHIAVLDGAGVLAPATLVCAGDVHTLGLNPDAGSSWRDALVASTAVAAVYVPRPARLPDTAPDLGHADAFFRACAACATPHVIVVSSTAAYGASPHHPGLAQEHRTPSAVGQPIARAWLELERLASTWLADRVLTILRAAPVPSARGGDYYSRLLRSRVAVTVAGYDPTVQFLSPFDLTDAVALAIDRGRSGVFNIVPAAPISLRGALGHGRVRRVAAPWVLHRAVAACAPRRAAVASSEQQQFARCHLTASGDKAARELGFVARHTSAAVVGALRTTAGRRPSDDHVAFDNVDPFGLDRAYIESCHRGVMGFLRERYWRVETDGVSRIPREGPGVLVGIHRGFMPFDGVMALLTVVKETGRIPRFLIHPGLLKFPYLFNLMSKLGGVVACQENASHVLASGELVGVYPEGIRGAFTMYRRAHRIGPSWRNDCIAFALRHRAPIVPFVTIGSAEIFPILGRIDAPWWKKHSDWPFIPLTPTFPLIPLPLPSKWHTAFLEPLHVEREHPPEAAEDSSIVRAIGAQLRARMSDALDDLRRRRKSIFFGSLLEHRT